MLYVNELKQNTATCFGSILLSEENLNGKSVEYISNKLHNATSTNLLPKAKEDIRNYTSSSKYINSRLLKGEHLLGDVQMHNTIMKNAKQSGHNVTLYSGTGVDFSHLAKQSKDGILHSPAHISATHDIDIANEFANGHILAIHVKPKDRILHISHISKFPQEAETIIPSGTNLKYLHSEKSDDNDIHHFEINDQKDQKLLEPPKEKDIKAIIDDHTKHRELRSLLRSDYLKPAHLVKIMKNPFIDNYQKEEAVNHHKANSEVYDQVKPGDDEWVIDKLVSKQNASLHHVMPHSNHERKDIRVKVARHPSHTKNSLLHLKSKTTDPDISNIINHRLETEDFNK